MLDSLSPSRSKPLVAITFYAKMDALVSLPATKDVAICNGSIDDAQTCDESVTKRDYCMCRAVGVDVKHVFVGAQSTSAGVILTLNLYRSDLTRSLTHSLPPPLSHPSHLSLITSHTLSPTPSVTLLSSPLSPPLILLSSPLSPPLTHPSHLSNTPSNIPSRIVSKSRCRSRPRHRSHAPSSTSQRLSANQTARRAYRIHRHSPTTNHARDDQCSYATVVSRIS